jgi:hypothetical protein
MASARVNDIAENLDFAMASNREVVGLVSEAQRSDSSVTHMSQKVGATLAAVRECYDYCAADLKEDFLTNKRQNAYYPFHPDSLAPGKTFHELAQVIKGAVLDFSGKGRRLPPHKTTNPRPLARLSQRPRHHCPSTETTPSSVSAETHAIFPDSPAMPLL